VPDVVAQNRAGGRGARIGLLPISVYVAALGRAIVPGLAPAD